MLCISDLSQDSVLKALWEIGYPEENKGWSRCVLKLFLSTDRANSYINLTKLSEQRNRKWAISQNLIYQEEYPYHSVPVLPIIRREWKQKLIRALLCVTYKLIAGSKTERTMSAVVNNFYTEAQNRQFSSFVTSASKKHEPK